MKNKDGFTLIELLVVLAITALLSTISIVYSHVGQNQISLSIESSKIAQVILEAKQLSIATYSQNGTTCAYGVQIDYTNQEYSLFEYNSRGANTFCPSIASTTATNGINSTFFAPYQSGSWHIAMVPGVKFVEGTTPASDTVYDVLFYPPDPDTMISTDGKTFDDLETSPSSQTSYIYMQTVTGDLSRTVSISPEGQVSL